MSTGVVSARPRRAHQASHPGANSPVRGGEAETGPRIGPNSVLQTLRAVDEVMGPHVRTRVRDRSGLPADFPEGLIPEAWFTAVVDALREAVPSTRSEEILARSGGYTADYVNAHRIPGPFRRLLGALPARLALPLLVWAFRRHAWTFAGGGSFRVEGPYPGTLVLEGCPTCRRPAEGRTGRYYESAFQGLLGLAAPGVRVREVECHAEGAPACRFQILLENPHPTAGDAPCASS